MQKVRNGERDRFQINFERHCGSNIPLRFFLFGHLNADQTNTDVVIFTKLNKTQD